jgi:hypothetical protein
MVNYALKENRTYDQVLGDLEVGNCDRSLTMYGEDITPNEHELPANLVCSTTFMTAATCQAMATCGRPPLLSPTTKRRPGRLIIAAMEVPLGAPPMNNNDARAAFMAPLFSGKGDEPPFDAAPHNRDNKLIFQVNAKDSESRSGWTSRVRTLPTPRVEPSALEGPDGRVADAQTAQFRLIAVFADAWRF